MFSRFRERFGTAGVVIAVIALVAALGGTAIAAGGLTGKQKKEVTKIAKKYAGQDGATGATGPAGLAGTNGTNGKDGANGTNGTNGSNGVSAEGVAFGPTEEPVGNPCAGLGGVEVNSASPEPTYVCNGAEGSPWTAGGTLPSGATEIGSWAASAAGLVSLSFPIRLAASLPESQVKKIAEGGTPPEQCDDGAGAASSAANPEADPGFLCVFVTFGPTPTLIFKPGTVFGSGAGPSGAIAEVSGAGWGSFAVTAAP